MLSVRTLECADHSPSLIPAQGPTGPWLEPVAGSWGGRARGHRLSPQRTRAGWVGCLPPPPHWHRDEGLGPKDPPEGP